MSKKADVLQQKSPAEFFAENKNIAGFDNVCPTTVACLNQQGPMQVLVCDQHGGVFLTQGVVMFSPESVFTRQSGSSWRIHWMLLKVGVSFRR